MKHKAPQKDPCDGYDLGEYRYAVAKFAKLLIRARAKAEPTFLSEDKYTRWGLADIARDPDLAETLVQAAGFANDYLWNKFIGPHGSGGIRLDDPLRKLKDIVIRFSLSWQSFEVLDKFRKARRIDWSRAAAWDLLPILRDELDKLPEPIGKNDSPVVLVNPEKYVVSVLNKEKHLTQPQYAVVKALVDVYPDTLTKDLLVEKSDKSDAVNILKRLKKSDADWKSVVKLAGSTGGGYGLIYPGGD